MITRLYDKKFFASFLALSLLASPVVANAQMSKVPTLSGEIPTVADIDPYVMPEDYPQDILQHFEENTDARSYIIIDTQTNRILAEKQGNTPYPIASMSKMLPVYLAYQAIQDGKIKLDDKIKIPQEIEDNMSFNPEMSSMGLYADTEYTVEELIYGIMLLSGNDATSALMWHLYGSEQDAVKAIRSLLDSWNIQNYGFYTTSGIPNQYIPESWWIQGSNSSNENTMSAADVAYVAQKLITDFPQILEVTSSQTYTAQEGTEREIIMSNPNQLLPGGAYGREGITGLKSGTTDLAGKNFVATGTENNRSIIAVAMGVFDRPDMELSSYWEIEILLNKLAEYPDLYQNEQLPTNIPEVPVPKETSASDESDTSEQPNQNESIPTENRRDNPLTNFMKSIFDFFNL